MKFLKEEIYEICFVEGKYPTPDNWTLVHICPICGSQRIEDFFYKHEMNYSCCKECKFIFMNPLPKNELLTKAYNGEYYTGIRRYVEIYKALNGEKNASESNPDTLFQTIIDEVHAVKSQGSWLDVGGGIGYFLSLVGKTSQHYQLYLNESNDESSNFAKSHFGLNVLSGDVDELLDSSAKYDIISFISVIEHISDPKLFLMKYANILNSDGVIVISIPQFSFLNRLLSKDGSYNAIPPYHVSLFSIDSLMLMIKDLDLIIEKQWYSTQPAFYFTDIVKTYKNFDVAIPDSDNMKQTVVLTKRFSVLKRIAAALAQRFDRVLCRMLVKYDGGQFVNLILKKGDNELNKETV